MHRFFTPLFAASCLTAVGQGKAAAQYLEDFESFAAGDPIAASTGPEWILWPAGGDDALVSDEEALSGTKSLKLESTYVLGGPQDVVLVFGGEGTWDVTFNIFVPEGNSGYYNVQENQVPSTAWAFECVLGSDGSINYDVDGLILATGAYTPGEWLKVTHLIDTDSNLMHLYLNDVYLAQVPYDGAQIGGVNFYAAGDAVTPPTYYVDDISVNPLEELQTIGCTDSMACNYDETATIDDGSCEYDSCSGCTDAAACNYSPVATEDDSSCIYMDALGACGGECLEDEDGDAICDDVDECIGAMDECGVCNGPGATYQCGCDPIEEDECDCFGNVVDECGICGGDSTTCLGDTECLDDDDSVAALGGCINAIAILGCDALWFGAPLSETCTFSCDACPCDSDINDNGICDDSEVLGCTYILADNYNADATLDDGSCLFTCYQETDLQQAYDNGVDSVEYPEEANNNCATDLDNDGEVATSDLLLFLSTFGDSCD